jgi:hypothetical protein
MYTYNTRSMTPHERSLQKEVCYSEPQTKTMMRIVQEQFLLWLFPTVLLLAIWRMVGSAMLSIGQGYVLLAVFYVVSAVVGVGLRYRNERRTATLMEKQSEPITEEFRTGQVEACEFQVSRAFILSEHEDEGPTYILDIGSDMYTIIGEHGNKDTYSNTPGNIVEVVRLPVSKRILTVNWSGDPLSITQMISEQSFHQKVQDWKEGDVVEMKDRFEI